MRKHYRNNKMSQSKPARKMLLPDTADSLIDIIGSLLIHEPKNGYYKLVLIKKLAAVFRMNT